MPSFGTRGVVDLKLDNDQKIDPVEGDIGLHAAPIVTRDTIIIGAALRDGFAPASRTNVKGYVRAFDVRTGRRIWTFHTIPTRTEFGADTWENGSNEYTGNVGVWAQMSVDEELGLVSAYHRYTGEPHGIERTPTHYWRWQETSPFHIDYCFVPRSWRIERVEVGGFDEWKELSDHRPLIVDVDPGGTP